MKLDTPIHEDADMLKVYDRLSARQDSKTAWREFFEFMIRICKSEEGKDVNVFHK